MRRAFTAFVLLAGTATFLYLLWSFGPLKVWADLRGFGWGFAVVLPFQLLDHFLNAWGWRLCFPPATAAKVPFWSLVRVRVAGDGVNYLTPSGNIAGEFVRPAMLGGEVPMDARITSVFTAKAAQAIGQALFILLGLAYVLLGKVSSFEPAKLAWGAAGVLVILGGVTFLVWALAHRPPDWLRRRFPAVVEATAPVRGQLKDYLTRHPLRMVGSTVVFMLGYAWGALEIWLIARFMGLDLPLSSALAIEFLSNLIDAMAFMVPAKIGTQEAGKAAIFAGLGLPPASGFTLGLIRHVRELLWAGAGLFLYASHARRAVVSAR
ncbi:MAG: lysylphosphatidylglycerol synthase domain-containing protein [Elusimicrobiota bacterium]|nr:lysylphosphatidylglycerol synthase domain-containing protein [Elusimicrobiota bacterium]